MVLCVHGEVTDPDVDVFDREAVFIERVLTPLVERLPRAEDRARAHHHRATRSTFVERARRQRRRDGHAAAPAHQPQRDVRRRPAGRTPIACPSPSARSTGSRCARPRRRARPNSSSAPTARRMRARPRKAPAAAPGIFNAPFALESYATVFEEEGALDRFEAFASMNGAALLRPAAQRGDGHAGARGQLECPDEIDGRRAVPRRRDAALAACRLRPRADAARCRSRRAKCSCSRS